MAVCRIATLAILLALLVQDASAAMTYILLRGTGSNCVSVDALPGSTLNIKYHLPDLKIKDREGKILGENEEVDTEGMDEAEAALLQRQREVAIKRARQGKDVSIAISQRTPFIAPGDDGSKPRERPRNQRDQPTEKEGTLEFETSPAGGPVQICVHSLFANKKAPYAVGLDITSTNDLEAERAFAVGTRGLNAEATDTVLTHLSAFSKEMVRAENLVRTILASADVVKKEEADFYEQSIKMEKSVHFWPMLQGVCLLVAATYQVRYILNWMKSKHIY